MHELVSGQLLIDGIPYATLDYWQSVYSVSPEAGNLIALVIRFRGTPLHGVLSSCPFQMVSQSDFEAANRFVRRL